MRVGTKEEKVEKWKGSMLGVERQRREVERGRGQEGRGVVEKDKREVESGRGGRGDRGYRGERGNSIMGCRTSLELWQVLEWNMLK